MTSTQLLVTLLGLAGIAWVNYYFFLAGGTPAAATESGGVQRVRIEVSGGYDPALVRVQAGRPVRLEFHRTDRSSCSEEIVLGDFGIRRFLPTGQIIPVEFTPEKPGTYDFACGMGMLHGKLIVDG